MLPRRATAELATASTQVLREHAENRGPRNVVANRTSPWLFPGNRPGQHIHSPYLMNQLAKNGIHLLGTRLAALRALVQEMPPAVAAQALGYTPECAEDHAIQAEAPWASYASHRRQATEFRRSDATNGREHLHAR